MSSETTHRRDRWLIWAIAGIAFIAAVLAFIMTSPREKPDKLVWMTPAQLTQTLKPGKLTRLKYKIMRCPGPWRWFTSHKKQVSIETSVVAIPRGSALPTARESGRTNLEGELVWIVGPEELKKVKDALSAAPGKDTRTVMHLTTLDGMQCGISSGNTLNRTSAFCGTIGQMVAKIEHGAFKLVVDVTSTEEAPPKLISATGVQTNISIACRAIVPNDGALIVTDTNRGISGTNYCMIISCAAVDSAGNPIKLEK
jgi:hypothetical protein